MTWIICDRDDEVLTLVQQDGLLTATIMHYGDVFFMRGSHGWSVSNIDKYIAQLEEIRALARNHFGDDWGE